MQHFYSPSARGFFCDEIHGNAKPDDCVAISSDQWQDLLEQQAIGKQIAFVDGQVTAIDPPAARGQA